MRRRRSRVAAEQDATTVYAAAALVLAYPDQPLLDRLPALTEAVEAAGAAERFAPVLAHLAGTPLTELQAHYAQEFDISRRHPLHLTYWIDGDTRRRGESLLRYKQAYRDSGLWVDLHGELPDYLPMVCEFAVYAPGAGRDLLIASRPALELLRFALRDDGLPHEGVVHAVCATLPGESPTDRLSVSRLAGWQPPAETVGLTGAAYAPYARLPILDAGTGGQEL